MMSKLLTPLYLVIAPVLSVFVVIQKYMVAGWGARAASRAEHGGV